MPDCCLILEPMPLIAHDLATTVHDDLGLEPVVAPDIEEARATLAGLPPGSAVRLAFVHHPPADFARSPLRWDLEARDAQIVLIGGGFERALPEVGWPTLALPFSTEHVLALIRHSLRDRALRPCQP